MTDVRCPHCDHAFFRHVGPRYESGPHHRNDFEEYCCRNCHSDIVIRTHEEVDHDWQQTTVISCLYCDRDVLRYIWSGDSMDGDAEHAFQCPECEDRVYSVRICSEDTATSPEYDTDNLFAVFSDSRADDAGSDSESRRP